MNNECNEFFLGVGEQGSRRKLKNFAGAFKEKIIMDLLHLKMDYEFY